MKYLQVKSWDYVVPGKLNHLEDYRFNMYKPLSNNLTHNLMTRLYFELNITLETKFSTTPFITKCVNK